jgi:hypothetical protein
MWRQGRLAPEAHGLPGADLVWVHPVALGRQTEADIGESVTNAPGYTASPQVYPQSCG